MPLLSDEDGLGQWNGSAQLHDHDHGRGGRNGRQRVHDNAELAVIRIALVGVQVRNLGHGQHRQQKQAQGGDYRQKAGGATAFLEPL